MQAIDIVGMGDSLTWGYPFGPEASWLNLAAGETGLKAVNRGISGETTGEMLARFDQDVVRPGPRLVTILGGTNDAWAGFAAAEVESNLRAMVDRARSAGIDVIICLPPPLCRKGSELAASFLEKMAGLLAEYRDACRRLVCSMGLKMLDFYTPLLDRDAGWGKREYFVDDAHPSIDGYKVMAAVAVNLFRLLK